MACRRRHGISRSSTFKEEIYHPPPPPDEDTINSSSTSAPSSPLSSRKNRDVHRDSPLSSAHYANNSPSFHSDRSKGGGTTMDRRPQDIQETYKLQNRKTETNDDEIYKNMQWQDDRMQSTKPQTIHEHQIMASRDVAIATAAKAKLLLREIKTVKADLAFAKERRSQLVEENKMLQEARDKGDHPADDDMIRLQLETLLAEKARLAHENSVYMRENSCLREIIKYHNLNMQDVVYLDEGIEEVTEVNPKLSRTLSVSP